MSVIRILITDDHGVLRAGLRALLENEPGIVVIGEAGSGEEALRFCEKNLPDVVLMDISMVELTGIETTRLLTSRHPGLKILILTVHEDKAVLQEAFNAGASGYVLKRALKSELLNAIHAVVRGDMYVHPSMTRALFSSNSSKSLPKTGPLELLTPRERDVLRLIAQGYTNLQIGDKLNISVRTVEYHRSNLMDKLYLQSRVELVRYASEHGLLEGTNDKVKS